MDGLILTPKTEMRLNMHTILSGLQRIKFPQQIQNARLRSHRVVEALQGANIDNMECEVFSKGVKSTPDVSSLFPICHSH